MQRANRPPIPSAQAIAQLHQPNLPVTSFPLGMSQQQTAGGSQPPQQTVQQAGLPATAPHQQFLSFAIKLNQPTPFEGKIDFEQTEAWIFNLENYFHITGLSHANQQARFASTLFTKHAAIWFRNKSYDLNILAWNDLRTDMEAYFKPVDYKRRARDELAACIQRNPNDVSGYIDAMKRIKQKLPSVTDDELLDRFIRGLIASVQREVLKADPATFDEACRIAERCSRLDQLLLERSGQKPKGKQPANDFDPRAIVPMDLDYMHGKGRQYDRGGRNGPVNRNDTCWICGKRGHYAKDCWYKNGTNNSFKGANRGRGRGFTRGFRGRSRRGRMHNIEQQTFDGAMPHATQPATQDSAGKQVPARKDITNPQQHCKNLDVSHAAKELTNSLQKGYITTHSRKQNTLLSLKITCNDKQADALIDSGASHNFISQPQLEALQLERKQWHWAEPMQISLANKSKVISSKVVALHLQFAQEFAHEVEFRVVPQLNHPIILGMPWLEALNPCINWQDRTIAWQKADGSSITVNATAFSQRNAIELCNIDSFVQTLKHARKSEAFAVRIASLQNCTQFSSSKCNSAQESQIQCRPDHPSLTQWFSSLNIHHFSLLDAISAARQSLSADRLLAPLTCKHCNTEHVDTGEYATRLHQWHLCNNCNQKFHVQGICVQGNPLARLNPFLGEDHELYCNLPAATAATAMHSARKDNAATAQHTGTIANTETTNITTEKTKINTEKFANEVNTICNEFSDVFEPPSKPQERQIKHRIDLLEPTAIIPHHRQYRMSQNELEEVKKQLDDLLSKGWIVHSTSQYNHPILFVRKKDNSLRMCIDYRSLNQNTIIDRYPLPRIDDTLDRLHGSVIFSKIDLASGYHQVDIEPEHRHRTAFQSRFGLFEYTVLPFGLCNAPATFQRLMNHIFGARLDEFVTVYLDDILIFSKSPEEHLQHLRWVFTQLRQHGLHAKRKKCEFGMTQLEYLGHIISAKGVQADPKKTEAIMNWPAPTCKQELQMFLGMCNYYCKFVRKYSDKAAPLYHLLRKDTTWTWDTEQQQAMSVLQQALSNAPILLLPNFAKPFRVETDASEFGVGGVLTQFSDGAWMPVAYLSKSLTSAERNYTVHDREMLAIVTCCKRWRPYLEGHKTVVLTDHEPLKHIFTQPCLNKRQVRWLEALVDTPIDIQYRPGIDNTLADALSRNPQHQDQPGTDSTANVARPSTGSLATILVEPQFLQKVHDAQHSDLSMRRFLQFATGDHPSFRLIDRFGLPLIYRINEAGVQQLVVPARDGLQQLLLEELHCTPAAGHLGPRKLQQALLQRVWFPKLRDVCTKFVRTCDTCKRVKDSTKLAPGPLHPLPVPKARFQDWSMDFITDLPISRGFNCIFTCVDRLTKFTKLIPCTMGDTQLSAATVARLFFNNVVAQFGVPQSIVSDRDPRFTATFWQELWQLFGSRTLLSTSHHPQTDGQTERMHRTIEQILRVHLLSKQQEVWADYLALIELALNSSASASTKKAPFELLYGENVAFPIDHALGTTPVTTASNYVARIKQAVKDASAAMHQAQQSQKRQYDKRHSQTPAIQVGDKVLLSTRHLPLSGAKKLAARFVGPFAVTSRTSSGLSFRLALPTRYASLHPVFHISQLKPYGLLGGDGRAGASHPPLADGSYEVERIISVTRHGRARVRWIGYGPEWDEYITLEELRQTAPEVVRAYELEQSS